jgi:hypothetical protein
LAWNALTCFDLPGDCRAGSLKRKGGLMSIGDKPDFDDGRTIVPSHHPMPGADDPPIDIGRKTGAQLPPARKGGAETHIDWDDRK